MHIYRSSRIQDGFLFFRAFLYFRVFLIIIIISSSLQEVVSLDNHEYLEVPDLNNKALHTCRDQEAVSRPKRSRTHSHCQKQMDGCFLTTKSRRVLNWTIGGKKLPCIHRQPSSTSILHDQTFLRIRTYCRQ